MAVRSRRRVTAAIIVGALMATVTSCATEYRGQSSGIDGVLWRQVASFEDALWSSVYGSVLDGSAAYLDSLPGERWDGRPSSARGLDLTAGGIILYDISTTRTAADVSVFIASGPRPAVPRDDGRAYNGPSQVYTCFTVEVDFASTSAPAPSRVILNDCPQPLVELLPEDAAFASDEVFDG